MPKKPEPRERYLDQDEINRLSKSCAESRNPLLLYIVLVALHSGMREAEILGLGWERVNLSTFTVTLNGRAPSGPQRTKSGRPRGIPINADLEKVFRAIEPDPSRPRSSGSGSRTPGSTTSATRLPRTT
jgi:integrase